MEVEVVYLTDSTGDNVTSVQNISYEFTDLRMDPDYIRLVDITVRRIMILYRALLLVCHNQLKR